MQHQKGCGVEVKTTTYCNLAASLGGSREKSFINDADPQSKWQTSSG